MKINIFYFIWVLIKTHSIIKTMRYIFDKYNVDTFEIKLLWKIITFTKEKDLCESVLSMESKTTWLSRYFNEYHNYPYALTNLDVINPMYYNIHNCLIKSFNKDNMNYDTIKHIIKYFPEQLFGRYYNRLKFNKLFNDMENNKIKSIKKYIKYMIKKSIRNDKTFIYQFNKNLLNYYDNELKENIMIDNVYLMLDHYSKILKLKYMYETNDMTYINLLDKVNINYLCIRQIPFTKDYVFMDLYNAQLYFSYGLKKCLFGKTIENIILKK